MSAPLAICHVLSSFGLGGQERIALELARAQKARGHHVLAVSIAPAPEGPIAVEFSAAGVAAITVAKRGGVDATLPIRLARVLLAHRVDVVHTHNPQALVYGAPAGRLVRAAVVHTKHGANPASRRRKALVRAAASLVDAFVAVSETTAEVARSGKEVALDRLSVIANGIDTTRYGRDERARAEVRVELGIDASARVVGTVGRVAPEKDHALLVRALAPHLAPHTRLVVAGDGPLFAALRADVDALGERARWVHLVGVRSDVPRLLAALDVFALSSTTEGLPVVLLEAMASGLPVVATAVGGIPTVVTEGETGFLTGPGDAGALGSAIAGLLSDAEKAAAIGARGLAVCGARFGMAPMVDGYLAAYRAALARRR